MNRILRFSFVVMITLISLGIQAQNTPASSFGSYDTVTEDIKVFPNPTTDYFQINNSLNVKKVIIYNMFGKEVKTFNSSSNSVFDVTDIKNGMYIVKMLDDKNKIVKSVKLQKSNIGA